MSDLFLKNSVKNSESNYSESSVNLYKILNLGNKTGGNYSITSNANLSKVNQNEVNDLLSMITSESNTNTNALQNNLTNLLSQTGGNNIDYVNDTELLKNKLNDIYYNQNGGTLATIGALAGLTLAGTGLVKLSEPESEVNLHKILNIPHATKVHVPVSHSESNNVFLPQKHSNNILNNNHQINTTTTLQGSESVSATSAFKPEDLKYLQQQKGGFNKLFNMHKNKDNKKMKETKKVKEENTEEKEEHTEEKEEHTEEKEEHTEEKEDVEQTEE